MDVLGVVAFFISAGLAGLEVWRQFFRKAKLDANVSWHYRNGILSGVQFVVFNVGHGKTILTEAGLRSTDDTTPEHFSSSISIRDKLPVVLDVDEASPRLFLPIQDAMTDGRAQGIVLVDHHKKQEVFSLPPFPAPDDPMFQRP